MENGCCTLISKSNWLNVITRLLCFDSGDDPVQLSPNVENNDDLATEAVSNEVASIMPAPPSLHTDVEMELEKSMLRTVKRIIDTTILCGQDKQTGKTLLHEAVVAADGQQPLKELVEFMIDNGLTDAAVLGDRYGNTALHLAVQFGRVTEACYLIKAAPRTVYQVNHEGVSPLYLAIKSGYFHDLVMYMFQTLSECLLPCCASEIVQRPKNKTLAHLAIKLKDIRALKLVAEYLPELVKATDEKGWTPLSYAANKGFLDGVTYLLANFPETAEEYDEDGYLPIHKAVGGGHVSIVEAFYKRCPQTLHCVDKKGRSVLHISVIYYRLDVFSYLTKEVKLNESFLNLRDNKGKTFIDYAKDYHMNNKC